MLRHIGGDKFETMSRGTAAQAYTKMPPPVQAFLTGMGIADTRHTPTLVSEEDINWADLVLVMENAHFEDLSDRFPQSLLKMHLFLDYCTGSEGKEQRDPMGGSVEVFNEILGEIRGAVEQFIKKL